MNFIYKFKENITKKRKQNFKHKAEQIYFKVFKKKIRFKSAHFKDFYQARRFALKHVYQLTSVCMRA